MKPLIYFPAKNVFFSQTYHFAPKNEEIVQTEDKVLNHADNSQHVPSHIRTCCWALDLVVGVLDLLLGAKSRCWGLAPYF